MANMPVYDVAVSEDPIELLRKRQQRDVVDSANRAAIDHSAMQAEAMRRQKAGPELQALWTLLVRDAVPRKPIYRQVEQAKPGVMNMRHDTLNYYSAIGGGWLLATREGASDSSRRTHVVLADDGRAYQNCLSLIPVAESLRGAPDYGPGFEWRDLVTEISAADVSVADPTYRPMVGVPHRPSLRLGVSAEETSEFYYRVIEMARSEGFPYGL